LDKGLLDTDILSEAIKGIDPKVAANATTYRRSFGYYTLSAVSVREIVRGFPRTNRTRRLHSFLASIAGQEVIEFDKAAGELAGNIAGDLERNGQTIGPFDPMIATIALQHGLELIIGNTSHSQRIQQLGYPLTLVNWRI
jgi:tRNA(fMet)-specific endonuclease VapC